MPTQFSILERIINSGELKFFRKKESEAEEIVNSFLENTESFEEGQDSKVDSLSFQLISELYRTYDRSFLQAP